MYNRNEKISSKGYKIIISILLVVVLLFGFGGGYLTGSCTTSVDPSVSWAIEYIEKYYYNVDEEGNTVVFDGEDYAKGIASLLDNYSEYYTAEEYSLIKERASGINYGVGLGFASNSLTVLAVYGNSPAYKSGVLVGDVITGVIVDGETTPFATYQDLADKLNSIQPNKDFTLTLTRSGEDKTVTVRREEFQTAYCTYYDRETFGYFSSENNQPLVFQKENSNQMNYLAEDIFYIKFDHFEGGAFSQFKECMDYAKTKGKTKLILDMRDNGGGYMNILCDIAGYLISVENNDNPVIVYAKNKKGTVTSYSANGNHFNTDITKISVIANEGSASATECLIGAMGYYKNAFTLDNLVLEINSDGVAKTYGKGIMQTTYENIFTQEAIKLTTAYIFQPDNQTTIHGVGFTVKEENRKAKEDCITRAIELVS